MTKKKLILWQSSDLAQFPEKDKHKQMFVIQVSLWYLNNIFIEIEMILPWDTSLF